MDPLPDGSSDPKIYTVKSVHNDMTYNDNRDITMNFQKQSKFVWDF